MNATRTARLTAALALAGALALTGCATTTPTPVDADGTSAPAASAPAEVAETEAPAPVESGAPVAPVADQYSQVVDGVLYQGTADAPVKVGTDALGQAPAAEATAPTEFSESGMQGAWAAAQAADKYLVGIHQVWSDNAGGTMGGTLIGYSWALMGYNSHGTWKALATGGNPVRGQQPFASVDAAVADSKVLDGRELDRAEYILRIWQ